MKNRLYYLLILFYIIVVGIILYINGVFTGNIPDKMNLVINLEQWKDGAMYDRLGLDNLYTSILDVKIPSVTIPVKPGRNLAVIIAVAAMNNRHKKMGYNAAQEFTKQINDHFDRSLNNMGE